VKKSKSYIILFVAIILMIGNVYILVANRTATDEQTVLAALSVIVTVILGITTFIQTRTQINIDKIDKTPFYELHFVDFEDDPIKKFYCKNCIPLLKIADRGYLDLAFQNKSGIPVSSVEIKSKDDGFNHLTVYKNKLERLAQQEENIKCYSKWLYEVQEDELGDGLLLFKKWMIECDTQKNTNYDIRVRELILHFYYYYENSFDDLTLYRKNETSNEERLKILEKIINNGTKKEMSFFQYFTKEKESIIYQLETNVLERNENKDYLKEQSIYETLDIDYNMIANTENFNLFYPFDKWEENDEKHTLEFDLDINTIYGYKFKQHIELVISNKRKFTLENFPANEEDILKLKDDLHELESRSYDEDHRRYYNHDKRKLEKTIKERGFLFIDEIKMSVKEQ